MTLNVYGSRFDYFLNGKAPLQDPFKIITHHAVSQPGRGAHGLAAQAGSGQLGQLHRPQHQTHPQRYAPKHSGKILKDDTQL